MGIPDDDRITKRDWGMVGDKEATDMLSRELIAILALLFCLVTYVMAVTRAVRRATRIVEWKTETEEDPEPAAQPSNAAE